MVIQELVHTLLVAVAIALQHTLSLAVRPRLDDGNDSLYNT